MAKFVVTLADVTEVGSDVLLLKYAQRRYGEDAAELLTGLSAYH